MNDTSGQRCVALLKSVRLQRSLASRLQANLDLSGSTEYVLTWKHLITPSRRWFCQLQASERHTAGTESTGWPTPRVQASRKGGIREDQENGHKGNLEEVVHLLLTNPGIDLSGLTAQTQSDEEFPLLNKEFCRWLQGYPEMWSRSAPTVTPSFRKSQQCLSKVSSKQENSCEQIGKPLACKRVLLGRSIVK